MKGALCAAVAAAAVASVGLPASASARYRRLPPDGATCTFHHGLTTCVQSSGFATMGINIDDPNCPSGKAEQQTETTTIETTTTVFRGTHQLGEPDNPHDEQVRR